jgi:hypothetical protein
MCVNDIFYKVQVLMSCVLLAYKAHVVIVLGHWTCEIQPQANSCAS